MTAWEMAALAQLRRAELRAEIARARAGRRRAPDDTVRCLVRTYATVSVITRR